MGLKMISAMLEERQIDALKALSKVTRIRMADYIREGIDLVLAKYEKDLRKSKKKGGD